MLTVADALLAIPQAWSTWWFVFFMLSVKPQVPTPTTPNVSSNMMKLTASLPLADLLSQQQQKSDNGVCKAEP